MSLRSRVFGAILGVSLVSVLATGLFARRELSGAFERYLLGLEGGRMHGRRMGQLILGAAEEQFLAGVDRGILMAAAIAVVLAAIVGMVLARYLSRPLASLTLTARRFATGDLTARAEATGPVEVAALAEAFNEMADSLATTEMLRQRMVADVAHELRDPLAALRAQTEALTDGVIEFDQDRARSLSEDIEELSRLVADLQELSVAEAGRLHYEPVTFDLTVLCSREAERAAHAAPAGTTVVFEGESGPVEITADERRIAQVLRNLLSNALRHTSDGDADAGEIRVSVVAGAHDVVVAVEDSGEGIPASALPHVFERFYRADSSRARATGGVGIGLAIVKRIIEDHGGEVFASNVDGQGARVGFRLPRTPR